MEFPGDPIHRETRVLRVLQDPGILPARDYTIDTPKAFAYDFY